MSDSEFFADIDRESNYGLDVDVDEMPGDAGLSAVNRVDLPAGLWRNSAGVVVNLDEQPTRYLENIVGMLDRSGAGQSAKCREIRNLIMARKVAGEVAGSPVLPLATPDAGAEVPKDVEAFAALIARLAFTEEAVATISRESNHGEWIDWDAIAGGLRERLLRLLVNGDAKNAIVAVLDRELAVEVVGETFDTWSTARERADHFRDRLEQEIGEAINALIQSRQVTQ